MRADIGRAPQNLVHDLKPERASRTLRQTFGGKIGDNVLDAERAALAVAINVKLEDQLHDLGFLGLDLKLLLVLGACTLRDIGKKAAGRQRAVPEAALRTEANTYELQALMRISYAVFCLKKKR